MLYRMLYYLYCDHKQYTDNELESLLNIRNTHASDDKNTPNEVNICLESKNDIIVKNKQDVKLKAANVQNSIKYDSPTNTITRQLKRKSLEEFPERIRHQIAFYEAKSCTNTQVNKDKKRSIPIRKLPEEKKVNEEAVVCPPPIVVGMILKENFYECDAGKKKATNLEKPNAPLIKLEIQASTQFDIDESTATSYEENTFDKRNSTKNSSILSNKDKGNERFLINLIEPRITKEYEKEKKVGNSTLIPMDSKLHITPDCEKSIQNYTQMRESAKFLNDRISDLIHKTYDQCQIIKQAEKALQTCKRSKAFINSAQRAEAERILLTAMLKRAHLLRTIENAKLEYPGKRLENTADLTISNVKFPFNVDEIDLKRQSWFLVTCTTDCKFYISSMFELNAKRSYLQLPDMYTFEKVTPDFKIKMCLYELKTDHSKQKKGKRLQKLTQKFSRPKLLSDSVGDKRTKSSFKCCGSLELTINNLSLNTLTLNKTLNGSLFSVVHLSASAFSSALNLKHCGFLTIGIERSGHLVWDKNWCKLLNSILHFWSNPSEECFNNSKIFIDLRNCVIVTMRNICLRSYTIILEYSNADDAAVLRYYLSCDTPQDYQIWNQCINSILDTFKGWKTLMYV